jgi:hypothetical protein
LTRRRFGPPDFADANSNGSGPVDVWTVRFPCGLEVALQVFAFGPSMSPLPAREPRVAEVYANDDERRHILFHLALPASDVWTPESGRDGDDLWRVVRQDDNGHRFEVQGMLVGV